MNDNKIRMVVTGGHLSPALAVIEEALKNNKFKIFYIGRKQPLEGDNALSLEYLTITKEGIPFHNLITGRFQREFTFHTLYSLIKFPLGLLQSFIYLKRILPDIVLTFGGYVALPVAIAAYLLNIPIIAHEQTPVLGLTNRIISKYVKILCLTWTNTLGVQSGINSTITGLPIRQSLFDLKNNSLIRFGNADYPLIYITGGNLGSHSINTVISKSLPLLLNKHRILHQCGSANQKKDYHALSTLCKLLPKSQSCNYKLVTHVSPDEVGAILSNAQILIGRSGANTCYEIGIYGLPSILIPLPWSAYHEQEHNAGVLEKQKTVRIISQSKLNARELIKGIQEIEQNYSTYRENGLKNRSNYSKDAAEKIVLYALKYAKKSAIQSS